MYCRKWPTSRLQSASLRSIAFNSWVCMNWFSQCLEVNCVHASLEQSPATTAAMFYACPTQRSMRQQKSYIEGCKHCDDDNNVVVENEIVETYMQFLQWEKLQLMYVRSNKVQTWCLTWFIASLNNFPRPFCIHSDQIELIHFKLWHNNLIIILCDTNNFCWFHSIKRRSKL